MGVWLSLQEAVSGRSWIAWKLLTNGVEGLTPYSLYLPRFPAACFLGWTDDVFPRRKPKVTNENPCTRFGIHPCNLPSQGVSREPPKR